MQSQLKNSDKGLSGIYSENPSAELNKTEVPKAQKELAKVKPNALRTLNQALAEFRFSLHHSQGQPQICIHPPGLAEKIKSQLSLL